MSEHYYQFHKLKAHDKIEDAFALLDEPEPFKVMRKAQDLLPEDQVSDDWKASAVDEMRVANSLKFCAYDHTRKALIEANLMIAEATSNLFWGTGLSLEWTRQCLPEFWPGQNRMGEILMDLRKGLLHKDHLTGEEHGKWKASSLLTQESAKHPEHDS